MSTTLDPIAKRKAAKDGRQLFQLTIRYPDGKKCLEASGVMRSEAVEKAFWKWFNSTFQPTAKRRGRQECDDDTNRVFTACNVCGTKIHTKAEDEMGMCERCAGE